MTEIVVVPGDVVLTTYGVAVVIKPRGVEHGKPSFKARLWRHIGKSVASSATAFLQNSCVIKRLPAAPGMTTETVTDMALHAASNNVTVPKPKIMIHCYSPGNDTYTVCYLRDDDNEKSHLDLVSTFSSDSMEEKLLKKRSTDHELFQLKSFEVAAAKCAKFYPLIDELISRGNAAAASAKSMFEENAQLKKLTQKLSKSLSDDSNSAEESSKTGVISTSIEKVTEVADNVKEKVKNAISDKEEVDKIYKMLRDEELTTLLSNGRDRLRHLVSGGLTESTQNALRGMGLEISNETDGTMASTIKQTRLKTIEILDDLLAENLDTNLESAKNSLGGKFGAMLDSFVISAKSDGTLNSILGEISSKTSELKSLSTTKSSSLFMEGAQRFQARVSNILSPKQLALCEKSGADLTKAFTEGDIAVAKLKSIELGDSVRSRLFAAIEVRSGTQGGLDSIIAGALSRIENDSVGDFLRNFQENASSNSASAQESLISLLSERSQFHDISILRIEKVFVDLESHIGEDLTAAQIAALGNGDRGTAALFEPIADRAAKEIQKQLDKAEESIEDATILSVIAHVRKIMSGDLTFSNLIEEIVGVLNSDDAVKAGTVIAQTGEQILDVIENASENKALSGVIGAVEKAGITKESVLSQIERLNVDEVLDTAGEAVTDEKKRLELLSNATDSALEFLLKILPSMPVPPFEGVRDGLIYSIKNLSMHGFKLKKEDIMVEIAGIRAAGESDPTTSDSFVQRQVKAADILVLDARNISAIFENALWSFEQTYMPYLKGNGRATVAVAEGHIRLEFELKKRPKKDGNMVSWEPVLCLNKRSCSISQLSISFEGASRLAWVANKLANMLKNPLRDYVVRVMLDLLLTKSGWLLENLNGILSKHWDVILKTTKLQVANLEEVTKNDITATIVDPRANEIDLVWNEHVPLGINLLLNDKSGMIKVVDFPRGSQARKVAVDRELDPDSFKGAVLAAVNGSNFDGKDRLSLMQALRDPSRPKTIKFLLAPKKKIAQDMTDPVTSNMSNLTINSDVNVRTLQILDYGPIGITFAKSLDESALVIQSINNDGTGNKANIGGFVSVGDVLVCINDTVITGAGIGSIEKTYSCLEEFGIVRPLSLGFMPSPLKLLSFETKDQHGDPLIGGPQELLLEQKTLENGSSNVVIKGYKTVDGSVESRGVFLGDHLVFINGMPIGSGMQLIPDSPEVSLSQVNSMLNDKNLYPMCLTFARPVSKTRNIDFDVESLDTKNMSVVATCPHQLGFDVGEGTNSNHFIVKKFHPVKGSLQSRIEEQVGKASIGLSIHSINGEKAPSYMNTIIALNAMKRAWTKNDKFEVILCNEHIKEKIATLKG